MFGVSIGKLNTIELKIHWLFCFEQVKLNVAVKRLRAKSGVYSFVMKL